MKHVVVLSDLRDSDIRPMKLMSRFRALSIEDARAFFGDAAALVNVGCTACSSGDFRDAYTKEGFRYLQCQQCRSVFVSPRPTQEQLKRYYQESRAANYRSRHLNKEIDEARRYHVLSMNAHWLGRLVDEACSADARTLGDLGTNYPIIFQDLQQLDLFDRFFAIDVLPGMEEACQDAGAEVVQEMPAELGVVTAFEQLEHQASPEQYLRAISSALCPGGMLFLTTRTIDGFDLQLLWDKVPYIYVPEHLNLLSIEGINTLLARSGFEVLEMSTPGQLDVELVSQAMAMDTTIEIDPFLKTILGKGSREVNEDLQAFLQKHQLSSHLRVAARKTTTEQ